MDSDSGSAGASSADVKPTFGKAVVFLAVLALIGAGIAAFIVSQRSATGPLIADGKPDAIPVKVAPVELSESFAASESFTGLVTPRRTSTLGFQSGGRIDAIRVDTGSQRGPRPDVGPPRYARAHGPVGCR